MRVLFYCKSYQDLCLEANLLHDLGAIPILAYSIEQLIEHIQLQRADLIVLDHPDDTQAPLDHLLLEDISSDQIVAVIPNKKPRLRHELEMQGIEHLIQRPITSADYVNQILHILGRPILKEARCRLSAKASVVSKEGTAYRADVVDLSSNGICFATEGRLAVGHLYILQLQLADDNLRSAVKVVWRHRQLKGCFFEMMGAKERAALVSYLTSHHQQLNVASY